MLSLEASEDCRFAREAPTDLWIAREVLMDDLESDTVSLCDAACVVHDARGSLAQHSHDLELTREFEVDAEGRQRCRGGHVGKTTAHRRPRVFSARRAHDR